MPGGAAVARAISDRLAGDHGYDHVVATKDFHIDPGAHFSDHPDFASSWPPHCVARRPARSSTGPNNPRGRAVFRKAPTPRPTADSRAPTTPATPLASWLRDRGRRAVDVVGIATDYCVATAADAAANSFDARVLLDPR